jgi:hypothetical protein
MLNQINNFYLNKEEPAKSCLMALREIICRYNDEITEAWKYRMPCFCYKGKPFCYLWKDKETGHPYILMVKGGLIEHSDLVQGSRAKMKILPIDPNLDIPMDSIKEIFDRALELY